MSLCTFCQTNEATQLAPGDVPLCTVCMSLIEDPDLAAALAEWAQELGVQVLDPVRFVAVRALAWLSFEVGKRSPTGMEFDDTPVGKGTQLVYHALQLQADKLVQTDPEASHDDMRAVVDRLLEGMT